MQLTDLEPKKALGAGQWGRVLLVQHRKTREVYALKCINRERAVKDRQQEHIMQVGTLAPPQPPTARLRLRLPLRRGPHSPSPPSSQERAIMGDANHPYITKLFATFKNDVYLYMLLEVSSRDWNKKRSMTSAHPATPPILRSPSAASSSATE